MSKECLGIIRERAAHNNPANIFEERRRDIVTQAYLITSQQISGKYVGEACIRERKARLAQRLEELGRANVVAMIDEYNSQMLKGTPSFINSS